MNAHEEGIANFVLKHRRHRYFTVIDNPKKRHEFLDKMSHNNELDVRNAHAIPKRFDDAALTYQYLKGMGAPDLCYAISDNDDIDGKEVKLIDALAATRFRTFCTILSFVPGKFVYCECEDDRFILMRP